MYLRNDTRMIEPPHELVLPGCSASCPLEKWLRLTEDVVPEDWEKECASHSGGLPLKLPTAVLLSTF